MKGGKMVRRYWGPNPCALDFPWETSDFSVEGEVLFIPGSEAELSRCVWVGSGP